MKKSILILVIMTMMVSISHAQEGKLEVGKPVPEWVLPDANKAEFSMDTWKGKVLQINFVDPDVSDLNDPFNDAMDKATDIDKIINKEYFKGFGIVDTKSTWKPNGIIRMIAKKKAKKYDTTILFDYEATLQGLWGVPADNYTVVLVDKNRVCRGLYIGEIPATQFEEIIKLVIELTEE